jgi:hypothetical protein
MRFIEYLTEYQTLTPKKHPGKPQWYSGDQGGAFWRVNMTNLHPDARFIGDEENEEVFAVSPNDEDECYGVWRYKEKHGVSFPTPRSLRITAGPRARFSDYQLP